MVIVLTSREVRKLDTIEESEEEVFFPILYEEHNVNVGYVQCFIILNNYLFRIVFELSEQTVPTLFSTLRILT